MKKQYITPESAVVEISSFDSILNTSIPVGEGEITEGGWSNNNISTDMWDEEE